MSPTPFSDELRQARLKAGRSQGDLAKKARVGQSTISSWETGRQLPQKEDKASIQGLERVAKVLGLDLRALEGALEKQIEKRQQFVFHSDSEYLAWQRAHVQNLASDGCKRLDIWLVGPETLPFRRWPQIRQEWKSSIANDKIAVHYCVVWFLCLVRKNTLTRLVSDLVEVGRSIPGDGRAQQSRIHHYGVRLIEAIRTGETAISEFEALTSEAKEGKVTGNEFKMVDLVRDKLKVDQDSGVIGLARAFSSLGTLTLYLPEDPVYQPTATLHLPSVRIAESAEPTPAWYCLDRDNAFDLAEQVKKFMVWVLSPTKAGEVRGRVEQGGGK